MIDEAPCVHLVFNVHASWRANAHNAFLQFTPIDHPAVRLSGL